MKSIGRSRIPASSHYKTWAALLNRVFGVAGWRCPQCGGAMRLRAHAGGQSTERILAGLERSARGPPVGQVFVACAPGDLSGAQRLQVSASVGASRPAHGEERSDEAWAG